MLELIARFLVIGTLAFGGGQAALPLVERLAVADTGWLTPTQFATGVGLSYATPGPVLILAAAMWRLARSEAGSVPLMIVLVAAFGAGLFLNAALIVGAAGAIGVAFDRVKRDA